MKYIRKRPQPQELIAWTRAKDQDQDSQPTTWNYDDMPREVRQAVKERLIQEQGGICCYTGRTVTPETSHIEHLKPQARCVGHEDTDYSNMLAAYPAANDPRQSPYGAHAKKDWYDDHLFVHPLRRDCEARLRYGINGKVSPTTLSDEAAVKTIKHLCLAHRELEQMRSDAIYVALIEQKLTKAQARQLMDAMDRRDDAGNFRQFCFAIKQACQKYLKRWD